MATARLRVFPHPEEDQEDSSNPSITIRLSELYPLLAQAYRDNYVWLRDFEDDELLVSNDLYEVVRAVLELSSVGFISGGACLAIVNL